MNEWLLIPAGLVLLLWLTTLLSWWQQKRARERWALEDARWMPSASDAKYAQLMLEVGAWSIDDIRRYQQAWDSLLETDRHNTLFVPVGTRFTKL